MYDPYNQVSLINKTFILYFRSKMGCRGNHPQLLTAKLLGVHSREAMVEVPVKVVVVEVKLVVLQYSKNLPCLAPSV